MRHNAVNEPIGGRTFQRDREDSSPNGRRRTEEMKFQDRIARLHENTDKLAAAFLEPSKDKRGFICPCGHGSGTSKKKNKNSGDGIRFTREGRWHCFACGHKGDIVEMYQYKYNLPLKQAMDELETMLGVVPDVEPPPERKDNKKSPEWVKAEFNKLSFSPLKADFRGLSMETLAKYGAKGCKAFKNPLYAGTSKGPRAAVVFPTAEDCYFVRALEHKDGELCDKWDVGGKMPFNLKALQSGQPVFLTEGVIDALSIIEAGGEAIGISGTDGIGILCDLLKKTPSPSGLLLAPDNDDAGRQAMDDWGRELDAVGVKYDVVDTVRLYGGQKDANDALCQDKGAFKQRIAEVYASKMQLINPWAAGVSNLVDRVESGAYEPIPTGVAAIDKMLGGGFQKQQTVVLIAPPATGKTSFCQELMEDMARHNKDFTCLYFCFEMAREQLQARSVSRIMREHGHDVSSLDELQGKLGWREGVRLYEQEVGGRVAYYGLGSGLSSSRIEDVEGVISDGLRYNAYTGRPAPFIVLDYLQLIEVEGKEEQEAIKATMARMKGIAVRNDTVVLAIGANNRETNKKGEVSMYGGRGSSSIEYGADIVLCLAETDSLETERTVSSKKLSLVMPKGRFYDPSCRADFEFNGKYSEFVPVDDWGQACGKKESRNCDDLFNL